MPSSTSQPGARIGKYQLLAHIATGGMGTVFRAHDESANRIVALKVLDPELSKNPILVERFKREARHAARLQHKNIVPVYESDEADGYHYISMEFIEGIDLSEYIRRKGKIHPEEARRVLIQACKALEHAFTMGITHRDIKPSNFLLANEEGRTRVKLTDLGLARMINDEEFRVTRAGTTVGTVDYMAPEQARDSTLADVRSDIYSLGCTLYHMLAGNPPFAEGGIGERIYKHLASDPPDIRQFNSLVTASLWTVLRRMLAKHPDDRFQTPTEVIDALRSINEPITPHRSVPTKPFNEDELSDISPMTAHDTPDPIRSTPPPAALTPATTGPVWSAARQQADPPTSDATKRKRQPSQPEPTPMVPDAPEVLGLTADQRQMAASQFSHAQEVIRSGGDLAYATQLLLTCCKLDPTNFLYRKLLREITREHAPGRKGSWFGSITSIPARGRMKAAKKAGEYRKVLEAGEELLTRMPGDVGIQLDMAAAAEGLQLTSLTVWLLEDARHATPKNKSVLRALAAAYEAQKRYANATALWEKLREMDPADVEAADKIRELAVSETLAKGNFRR